MLSEQKLLDALPATEAKVSELARQLGVEAALILEVALRLQKRGCVKVRKPFLRERRILKVKASFEEGTKVIAVMNLKGGVGKTVTALNLAACLADLGNKTLLIDLDPQASVTSALKVNAKTTVYGLLVGTKVPAKAIYKTQYDNLHVIPSEIGLAGAEVEVMGVDAAYRLWEALEWVKDDYRYVIIDCPPSLSMLSVNALAAANSILIPVQCDQFALESLEKMMETARLMKSVNDGLHIEGLLLTMHDSRNSLSSQVAEAVKTAYGGLLLNAQIARDNVIGEAISKGMPIIHYKRDSHAAESFMALAKEVAANGR
jgi:chromosome partitioning protein